MLNQLILKYIEVYFFRNKIALDANNIEISAENYMAERKNLVTLLNEFFKKLPLLIK